MEEYTVKRAKEEFEDILYRFIKIGCDTCQTLADAEPHTLLVYMAVEWWKEIGSPKTFLGQKVVPMQLGDAMGIPMFIDWATKENGVHEDEKGE